MEGTHSEQRNKEKGGSATLEGYLPRGRKLDREGDDLSTKHGVDDDRVKGVVKTHVGVLRIRGANTGGKGGGMREWIGARGGLQFGLENDTQEGSWRGMRMGRVCPAARE